MQKFCSATCRSKAHHQKTKTSNLLPVKQVSKFTSKIEKMSAAGIGNATAGALAADVLKNAFTNNNNKPATKGDILLLKQSYDRYQRILNMPVRSDGMLPYFDMQTKFLVYLKPLK
ncbi:hypothetical protein [Maribacter litoralis]|uniref:hypothetical protein n=1 Tax=Maribacter litoralis TaxID=2059726 RepID=UPI003D26DCFC